MSRCQSPLHNMSKIIILLCIFVWAKPEKVSTWSNRNSFFFQIYVNGIILVQIWRSMALVLLPSQTVARNILNFLLITITSYCIANFIQDRQQSYESNIEARLRDHCCRRKLLSITYSKCVSVALIIQHAMRMSTILMLSVACLVVSYFSHIS